jgi:hypothetical protein
MFGFAMRKSRPIGTWAGIFGQAFFILTCSIGTIFTASGLIIIFIPRFGIG